MKNKTKSKASYKPKTTATTTTLRPIQDVVDTSNQGILLVHHDAMQKVYTNSGKNAVSNEFQTHFWSVNFRYTAPDGSILDIAIPTVYFNYEQEVSTSAIDFDLKDVSETSEKLEPVHHMLANQLLATDLLEELSALFPDDVKLDIWNVPLNSIHRHPGSLHTFSGTDYCKTASEPGVVYPLAKPIKDQPNFAGIMTIHNGICKVGRFEYRIANGELGTDIQYRHGRCATYVIAPQFEPSMVERLFGEQPKAQSYSLFDQCTSNEIFDAIYKLTYKLYIQGTWRPFTDSVVESNVKTKVYAPTYYSGYSKGHYSTSRDYSKGTYTYHTKEELNELFGYQLNDIYKRLSKALNPKTPTPGWKQKNDAFIDELYDLQTKLGYKAAPAKTTPGKDAEDYIKDYEPTTIVARPTLLTEARLLASSKPELLDKLIELEEYYYQDPDFNKLQAKHTYKDYSTAELRKEILDLQEDIELEEDITGKSAALDDAYYYNDYWY